MSPREAMNAVIALLRGSGLTLDEQAAVLEGAAADLEARTCLERANELAAELGKAESAK